MARKPRDPEGRMALRAHLVELRNRLLISAVAILVCTVAGWFLYPWVLDQLTAPLLEAGKNDDRIAQLNYATLTGAIDQRVRISLWLGLILASPMWLYQAWAFVTPGLTKKERWYALGFLAAAVPLFLGGIVLAWAVLPNAVVFLVSIGQSGTSTILTADQYISFVTRTFLAFGIAFLTPVVMIALTMAGLVSARTWLKGWRLAVIVAFVFAAIASPSTDVFSMFALAVPMIGLYFMAVAITWFIDRRRVRRMGDDLGLDPELDDDTASVLDYSAAPVEPVSRHVDAT